MTGAALPHIPAGLDLSAVAVGASAGAASAARRAAAEHIDVIGVAIIGIATGLGGSMLRDLLLGQVPAALRSDRYLLVALAAAAAGMAFAHLVTRATAAITVLDAASIGLYLALGIGKADDAGLPITASVLVGIAACTGGGVLRDVLLGDRLAIVRVGSWYIASALPAAAVFLVVRHGTGPGLATTATTMTAFTLRILAWHRSWTTPLAKPLNIGTAPDAPTSYSPAMKQPVPEYTARPDRR
ncbi:trimeric intracellular cation channel family protein [Actinomadura rupiterrae]|uniref:trimeric intracellular cation channel family protein n=1 Tax=Actinomadura rupiterrae TaxID=559627 RepID=UPI0020A3E0FA|nr:TRIC cation channel family protein [Actinomadura rupiterrae]MCP2342184.1 putative membrane protein YeiH [Actinomadura rupiterrae]